MASIRKNQGLIVALVLMACFAPALSFVYPLHEYTQEISKRSFAVMDGFLDREGLIMKFGYPFAVISLFFVLLNEICGMLASLAPLIGKAIGFGGPLSMLAGFPTDMVMMRNSEEPSGDIRDQRMLEYVDDQVKAALSSSEFENELKKKK